MITTSTSLATVSPDTALYRFQGDRRLFNDLMRLDVRLRNLRPDMDRERLSAGISSLTDMSREQTNKKVLVGPVEQTELAQQSLHVP